MHNIVLFAERVAAPSRKETKRRKCAFQVRNVPSLAALHPPSPVQQNPRGPHPARTSTSSPPRRHFFDSDRAGGNWFLRRGPASQSEPDAHACVLADVG